MRLRAILPALALVVPGLAAAQADEGEAITRIAFGSCLHQDLPSPIWAGIRAFGPEVFVFLGDNIYGDTEDMGVMRGKYEKLRNSEGYRGLREIAEVLAIWDDHDYGVNDGGAEYPQRESSQREFLRAFEVPEDRRAWSEPGIFDVREMGEEGRRVQFILLDTRYFRSPLVKLEERTRWGPYGENDEAGVTVLGEAQWTWLKEVLARPADVRIVASSIQVLPVDHHWERWQNLPAERVRLIETLGEAGVKNVIITSGDRHLGEIMRLPADDAAGLGQDIYELTASGMNRAGGGSPDEPNRYRLGENFQGVNFGTLEIDWAERRIEIAVRDAGGEPVRTATVGLE